MSNEFELFDCDVYPDDDEPEHVCTCNVMHDDLEHAENLCSACGLMIVDPWAPAQELAVVKESLTTGELDAAQAQEWNP